MANVRRSRRLRRAAQYKFHLTWIWTPTHAHTYTQITFKIKLLVFCLCEKVNVNSLTNVRVYLADTYDKQTLNKRCLFRRCNEVPSSFRFTPYGPFLPHDATSKRGMSYRNSVRSSVCRSVRHADDSCQNSVTYHHSFILHGITVAHPVSIFSDKTSRQNSDCLRYICAMQLSTTWRRNTDEMQRGAVKTG